MEFDGQYLTYEEYQSLGGTLTETSFNVLEFEARKQIDLRTQNRLKFTDDIPMDVKLCDFHLIEKINEYAQTNNSISNKASETIDGYSVSYITATQVKDIITSKNAELNDLMLSYLYAVIVNNEHVIYNGVK